MEDKNKEVRITIIVVVVLFLIILLSSLWALRFHVSAADGGGGGAAFDKNGMPSSGTLINPDTASSSPGKQALNNKLLAAEAYRPSAEAGDAEAQFKLGEAYSNGQIVPSDPIAIDWYRKSAAQGFGLAQNRLGRIYEHGGQAPDNLIVAYALYRVAASHAATPSADAQKNIDQLKKTMSAQQINDGDVLTEKLSDLDNFLLALDRSAK